MQSFETPEELVSFAIEKEQEAVDFYRCLAEKVWNERTRWLLLRIADEEADHKRFLETVETDRFDLVPDDVDVACTGIPDRWSPDMTQADLDPQQAIIIAMSRERSAWKLYMKAAHGAKDEKVRKGLLALAQSEARHKLDLEVLYDEYEKGHI